MEFSYLLAEDSLGDFAVWELNEEESNDFLFGHENLS